MRSLAWLVGCIILVTTLSGVASDEGEIPMVFYPFDIRDPLWSPTESLDLEAHGTVGLPFEKEFLVLNRGPDPVEDLVLVVGLSKFKRYPPERGPARWQWISGSIPLDWGLETLTIEVGSLMPEENHTFTLRGRIRRVGRYYLLLRAQWEKNGERFEEDLFHDRIELILAPRHANWSGADLLWFIALAFLGIGLVNYLSKRRST